MAKKLTFLGIETSCDETAAAVIRENDNVGKVQGYEKHFRYNIDLGLSLIHI